MEGTVGRKRRHVRIEEVDGLIEDDIFAASDSAIASIAIHFNHVKHASKSGREIITHEVGAVSSREAYFAGTIGERDMDIASRPKGMQLADINVIARNEVIRGSVEARVRVERVGCAGVGHSEVPEELRYWWCGGEHGDISFDTNDTDRTLCDTVGMLVTWRGALALVAESEQRFEKLVGAVVAFGVNADEAVDAGI